MIKAACTFIYSYKHLRFISVPIASSVNDRGKLAKGCRSVALAIQLDLAPCFKIVLLALFWLREYFSDNQMAHCALTRSLQRFLIIRNLSYLHLIRGIATTKALCTGKYWFNKFEVILSFFNQECLVSFKFFMCLIYLYLSYDELHLTFTFTILTRYNKQLDFILRNFIEQTFFYTLFCKVSLFYKRTLWCQSILLFAHHLLIRWRWI